MKQPFKTACKPIKNILRLYWPKFPSYGPRDISCNVRGTMTAKKWRRVKYWQRQLQRKKYS